MKTWIHAAAVRAVKTVAQTAVSLLTVDGVAPVDWLSISWQATVTASALAGVVSVLTSVAGLPEVQSSSREL